jgi:hypothetical protein
MLGAGFIGGGLQRSEQEIQSARAIGPDPGQFGRRFRQLLLGFRRGNDPRVTWRIVLGKSRNRHGCQNSGCYRDPAGSGVRESQGHQASLDTENRAAKQHVVKDL